ncbi:hypothetical protein [Paenibacillus montanisoli]|uniref:Uncharacterized protein n=1 Tax=Paenibacillus montanisoli TaxID=2081970 RepID=A0A328TX06_9BACL|nr:hypothetical protein [Paenibacillus montanisoli]RAP75017.1 hypothetical protein DL346_16620 [Paenibacillus montanisoli]
MAFKKWLARLLLSLFTLLFIYPAILFAVLVLGFTDAWKPAAVMLASALLLRIILQREVARIQPARKPVRKAKPSKRQQGSFPGLYNEDGEPPPQLSDIYFDLATHLREQEEILRIIKEQNRDGGHHAEGCPCGACRAASYL